MPLDALYQEVKHDRLQRLLQFYADGTYRPFIWPWDTLPALYLFLGLLVLPRVSDGTAKVVRPLLIVLILGQGLWTCIRCRTIGMAGGYGIGLANDWGFIMTGALLVFNDVKRDFKRLEKRADAGKDGPATQNGSMKAQALDSTANAGIRRRRETDGSTLASATTSSTKVTTSLMWKEYPDHIGHCMGWIIDLLISFRGVNWSFRLPTFAPIDNIAPPFPDKKQLKSSRAFPVDSSLQQVQRNALRSFVFLYFAVDLAKTLVIHDPYYLGLASLDSPHPLWLLQPYQVLTRTVRVFLSLYSVIVALSLIFYLSPLLYPFLPTIIPPNSILTSTALSHPAMYPPYWSPTPLHDIANSGLAAFWSRVWHQMFRFGISQPPVYLSRHIPYLAKHPRSQIARAVQLLTGFLATASIHAFAAWTSFPPNPANPPRPLWGSGLFFVLQALGIMAQTAVARVLVRDKLKSAWPMWMRGAGNLLFVAVWLWYTGPILSDDFARCGVWLFEPIPISVFRGLLGEGWWCWGGRWAGLVYGEGVPWYRWGIAIY